MSNANDLFAAGDIVGARSVLIDQLRSSPGDVDVRMFLFQLFSLTGEWKRAKDQLEMLAKLTPEAQMLSVAYSQCIDAEKLRADIFAGEAEMPLLAKVKWGEKLTTLLSDCFKNKSGATAALLEFQNAIPDTKGTIKDGVSFDWISDSDPRFGPSLEVIIAGKYGLLPFAALETLTIYEPSDLRDTIWAQAEFGMRKGAKVAGFIPVRYPNSENSEDSAIVRGASTVWTEQNGLETGLGHRLLMMSGDQENHLLSFRQIVFEGS